MMLSKTLCKCLLTVAVAILMGGPSSKLAGAPQSPPTGEFPDFYDQGSDPTSGGGLSWGDGDYYVIWYWEFLTNISAGNTTGLKTTYEMMVEDGNGVLYRNASTVREDLNYFTPCLNNGYGAPSPSTWYKNGTPPLVNGYFEDYDGFNYLTTDLTNMTPTASSYTTYHWVWNIFQTWYVDPGTGESEANTDYLEINVDFDAYRYGIWDNPQ